MSLDGIPSRDMIFWTLMSVARQAGSVDMLIKWVDVLNHVWQAVWLVVMMTISTVVVVVVVGLLLLLIEVTATSEGWVSNFQNLFCSVILPFF